MNSYERKRRICKMIVLVLGILSINNIILTIRNYSYAYFEKNVKTGVKLKITTLDEMPSKSATDYLKKKVISNVTDTCDVFTEKGGLVAINTDGTLYQEGQEIREYRYVGPDADNYIYFNCEDNKEPNASACEIWRILGIFKDEEGQDHIKIVRNETLSGTRTWDSSNNDWVNSDLKDYLNTTYYNSLTTSAKDMIVETKYYLGNYKFDDTTLGLYTHERGDTPCSGSCSVGDIWKGNHTTWNGNITLMYPSDYGYTANSCNWTKATSSSSTMRSSWLYQTANHSDWEWLLSPSSSNSNIVAYWYSDGRVNNCYVTNHIGVRPCLNLKSQVRIVDGDGSELKPFVLNLG